MAAQVKQLEPGIYFGLDDQLYHRQKALSAHGAVNWREHPMKFWLNSPYNPDWNPPEPTPAMKAGSAAHKLLLEPDDFRNEFAVMPYDDFLLGSKQLLTSADYRRIEGMVNVIRRMPELNKYFVNGFPEVTIIWDDPDTGLRQRARHDYLKPYLTLDYKTIKNLSEQSIKSKLNYEADGMQVVMYFESRLVAKAMLKDYFAAIDSEEEVEVSSPIYAGPNAAPKEKWLRDFATNTVDDVWLIYQAANAPWPVQPIRVDEATAMRSLESLRIARRELAGTLEKFGETNWPQCSGKVREFSSWHGYTTSMDYA